MSAPVIPLMDQAAYMALGVLVSMWRHGAVPESLRDIVAPIIAQHDAAQAELAAQREKA